MPPHAKVNHEIRCFSKNGNTIYDEVNAEAIDVPENGFIFYCFAALDNGYHSESPPFDMVKVEELEHSIFKYSDLNFELRKIIT